LHSNLRSSVQKTANSHDGNVCSQVTVSELRNFVKQTLAIWSLKS